MARWWEANSQRIHSLQCVRIANPVSWLSTLALATVPCQSTRILANIVLGYDVNWGKANVPRREQRPSLGDRVKRALHCSVVSLWLIEAAAAAASVRPFSQARRRAFCTVRTVCRVACMHARRSLVPSISNLICTLPIQSTTRRTDSRASAALIHTEC